MSILVMFVLHFCLYKLFKLEAPQFIDSFPKN